MLSIFYPLQKQCCKTVKNMNLVGSNLTLPLATSKVTLGRLPEGSVPQFPFLSVGIEWHLPCEIIVGIKCIHICEAVSAMLGPW